MAKERAIVVGAGGISGAWFPALKAEKVEVAAIVELNLPLAKKKAEQFGIDPVLSDNLAKTLRTTEADFVVDLTVPDAHCKVTCAALRAGFHVIGEKPMANSMAEARRMVKTAEETGRMYMVSQSRRWDPVHEGLARAVKQGRIGVLTTLNCDFFKGIHFGGFRDQMDSPLILDMAIHHFDMARLISGKDPVAVYAEEFNPYGSWYRGDVAANCIFEMADGVRFAYRGSWCAEGFQTSWNGNWRVIGERGTILFENDVPPRGQVVAGSTGNVRPTRDIAIPLPKMPATQMHGGLREMLRFLRTGTIPQTECHDNIKSLAMVFGAMESSRKRKRIEVGA